MKKLTAMAFGAASLAAVGGISATAYWASQNGYVLAKDFSQDEIFQHEDEQLSLPHMLARDVIQRYNADLESMVGEFISFDNYIPEYNVAIIPRDITRGLSGGSFHSTWPLEPEQESETVCMTFQVIASPERRSNIPAVMGEEYRACLGSVARINHASARPL